MKTQLYSSWWSLTMRFSLFCLAALFGVLANAQTLPYQVVNNSTYPDNQVYVAIVGITDGHVWVDATNGQVNPMSPSYNTVPGPVIGGNMGPGGNGLYANCFRKLSDIPNKTINIPKIAGCRIMISFGSQMYLYFFGHSGSPSGYAAPNLSNPTDPNQGIKYELAELTYNEYGLWINTTRVDSYQYPMGLEVWGSGFYKKVGELKTHQEIISQWQATAPSEFQGLLNAQQGIIHFPTKTGTFPTNFFQSYIDAIWSKYTSQQLVFNSGQAGVWRGNVSGNQFIFHRDGDNQLATIPGKPTTIEAMEGSGVLASGGQWDKVVQAQFVAAITRHAIDLNLGSGVMQDFGDVSKYYQTWPYNWYSKFFHRSDISFDSQTYTFAYDDVFDQSATVHTASPTSVKITLGGFPGGTSTSKPVTLYQHCNYGGYAVSLATGSYTLSQLQALGVANDDISSLKVQSGYKVTMYQHSNFTGNTLVKTGDDACLVDDGFNDDISSLVIAANTFSQTIEAENYTIMSGVQTENCSEGTLNVGWIDTNDWMVWDVNIPSNGQYKVEYRVASPNTTGSFQLEKAGGSPVYGSMTVPNTGGWQNWTTISHNVTLTAGAQQIAIKATNSGWNINWIKISAVGNARVTSESDLDEDLTATQIILFPNPAADFINFKGLNEDVPFSIYDMSGKAVLKGHTTEQRVNISVLGKGYYVFINGSTGEKIKFSKK